MRNKLGHTWRQGFGVALAFAALAGCSSLVVKKEQVLRELVASNHGTEAQLRVSSWLDLRRQLDVGSSLSEGDKVRLANDFFNGFDWRADLDNWQQEDYWATPMETLVRGAGDCEDLAIAKYFTLVGAGIDAERLRLTYVWQVARAQAHMVLAYLRPGDDDPIILDNLDKRAVALSERSDLDPVYSFNNVNLWLAGNPMRPVKVSSQDRLEKWRWVNQRMQEESKQGTWL